VKEEELRALVRESIARHLAAAGGGPRAAAPATHPSHFRYAVTSGDESDGPCLIEPAVRCNHCGYCQSQGY
jgi:hypothetical protein